MSSTTFRRPGFTLIELLVVIFIIGLLAALLLPAIYMATRLAQQNVMSMEIAGLKQGVEAYKLARNDYPPNFSEGAPPFYTTAPSTCVALRHLRAVYPKMNLAAMPAPGSQGVQFFTGGHADNIDEAEALVFWLSYTMDDVRDPLTATKSGNDFVFPKTRKVFFEFDEKRLVDYDNDGFYAYKPKYAKESHYVYFDSRSYGNTATKYNQGSGVARPYFKANGGAPTEVVAANTFQIICAGRDGDFGPVPGGTPPRKDITFGANGKYPTNTAPDFNSPNSTEKDNLTSFSEGILENLLP